MTPYFAEQYQLVEVRGNGESWLMHAPPEVPLRVKEQVRCMVAPGDVLLFDMDGLRVG